MSGVEEMSPTGLANLVEHAEAAAYADLLTAAPATWQCVAEQTPAGWLLLAPPLDLLLFNRLIAWGLDNAAPRTELESALSR